MIQAAEAGARYSRRCRDDPIIIIIIIINTGCTIDSTRRIIFVHMYVAMYYYALLVARGGRIRLAWQHRFPSIIVTTNPGISGIRGVPINTYGCRETHDPVSRPDAPINAFSVAWHLPLNARVRAENDRWLRSRTRFHHEDVMSFFRSWSTKARNHRVIRCSPRRAGHIAR